MHFFGNPPLPCYLQVYEGQKNDYMQTFIFLTLEDIAKF